MFGGLQTTTLVPVSGIKMVFRNRGGEKYKK